METKSRLDQNELAQLRTVLAGERTFAAWVRTGLSCIAGGMVLVKLVPFGNPAHVWVASVVGQALIGLGLLLFLFAFINYRRMYRSLGAEEVSIAPVWVFGVVTVVLVGAGALLLWLIL